MAGSIQKVGNKYRLHYMFNGNRYSKTISARNKTDAEKQLAEYITSIEKGSYANTNVTFTEFANIWLKDYIVPNASPITTKKYISYLNNRILPYLGEYKLSSINVAVLNNFFNEIRNSTTQYSNRENKPITQETFMKIKKITSAILEKAVEYEYINSNPVKKIKIKWNTIEQKKLHTLSSNEYKLVLDNLPEEDLEHRAIIETALKTGLRKSELFGLKWQDIDLKYNLLSVNKTRQKIGKELQIMPCKTKSSIRTISIPKSLANTLKELKKKASNEFVFNLNYNSILSWWKSFQLKLGIEPISFHDIRHTHASILLLKGIDIKTISERLGHSSISMTMDIYTDVLKELDMNVAKVIDEI